MARRVIFIRLNLKFFLLKIFRINPRNSIQEITEIKIKEMIKIYIDPARDFRDRSSFDS